MDNRISGDEARLIRKAAGMTLAELAAQFGVSSRIIQMWEKGQQPIDGRTALAYRWIARGES